MQNINISNLGPIRNGQIQLSDFTVLVGPQASGKSVFLQTAKLLLDHKVIISKIKKYGYDWKKDSKGFLELYYGEGMSGIWSDKTEVIADGKAYKLQDFFLKSKGKAEKLFYIPAQRVITLLSGWPSPFTAFDIGNPYVVRNFSEQLRLLMEAGLGKGKQQIIFPQDGRLKNVIKLEINKSIFHDAEVKIDAQTLKRRFVLTIKNQTLPFYTWSAGQREFTPMLLGLYWLMPSSASAKKRDVQYVVIEEPEMGLHPQAIKSVMLVFLELLSRGYKLIVSTHSPMMLEMVWAIKNFQDSSSDSALLFKLFNLNKSPVLKKIFEDILMNKKFSTFYFDNNLSTGVEIKDISSLDPSSIDDNIANWGGLTEFSTIASETVTQGILQFNEV